MIHLAKLPNGSELKQAKVQAKIVKPVVELSEVTKPNSDTSAPPQSDAAPSLLSDTKKEKKKKNKRINKSSETARTTSAETNMEVQQETQARTQTVSPPKLVRETEEKDKEEASASVQSAKKSKKDRWRNRRNKNANSKDEQLVSEATNQALNGDSEGNDHSQDEKKVGSGANQGTLVSEIAKARQHIKNSLERMDGIAALAAASPGGDVLQRLANLEIENKNLVELTTLLKKTLTETQNRVETLENRLKTLSISGPAEATKQPIKNGAPPAPKKEEDADDDDGVDLFGSDSEEDEAAAKVREQRLAEYAAKKSKKPALIAKSSLVLDIKPWDDETDLKLMEAEVRKITSDGLLWGASKFVPVAFGIKKLTISCVVEDEKVSIDWLTEQIELIEDYVQSVDVAAFNKI
ncbi:unnamed protein product [Hermetia illucens]|uniref:Elongation factor 1-delta n=2 Tax=Hermetia illucens TaxID=343691 RepID=A0A7R8V5C5_HERIL|nr:unnamed protein product [Hermetia illucens]